MIPPAAATTRPTRIKPGAWLANANPAISSPNTPMRQPLDSRSLALTRVSLIPAR
jgi:hypothetical protein